MLHRNIRMALPVELSGEANERLVCSAVERTHIMCRFAIAIAAAAFIPFAAFAQDAATHSAYTASVATYKPIQGFSHVVGSRHFVGYFVMAKDGCAVTVINATAGDDRLIESPRRQKIAIPAGGRTEVQADHGKALGIACTADADAIKVVALEPRNKESASR